MRNFGKRGFALFLALMLCLSLFPSALAEDTGRIAAAEDAPEQEGTIAPAEEGSIRPAEEGDALPRTDETQDGETSGQCGDDLSWSFDEATGTLTITGSGAFWDWRYPAYVPWYGLNGSIKNVVLPSGLTSIGSFSFYGCSGLTSIELPVGVDSIGRSAFVNCSGLTSVTIPNTVRILDEYAFYSCSGLTSVVIPGSVKTIGKFAFRLCSGLTSVDVEEGVESILDSTFVSCNNLSIVTLPGSLTYCGSNVFNSCSVLQDVYFGGTVEDWKALQVSYDRTKIAVHCADGNLLPAAAEQCGDDLIWSFDEATGTLTITGSGEMWDWVYYTDVPWDSLRASIKSVELPRGMINIGNQAFFGCSGLTSVTIPGSVTGIGDSAFGSCSGLTSVMVPDGVLSIGNHAFSFFEELTNVTIPGSVISIGESAFQNCTGLTELTIPEGVVSIGLAAFGSCSGLASVTIPASATEISPYIFRDCDTLHDIFYAGTCEAWHGLNLAYDRGSVTVHCADGVIEAHSAEDGQCGEDLFWSLENGVLTITGTGDMWNFDSYNDGNKDCSTAPWFAQRDSITQIRLAEGVTGIGNYAFSTYSLSFGWNTCANLVSVELPETLQRIGTSGFGGCTALMEIGLPGSLRVICDFAFAECGFTELVLPESLETIGSDAFLKSKVRSLTIPSNVIEIGNRAFESSSLNEIRFLGDAPLIDVAAFFRWTGTAYYPQDNPTWTDSVRKSYSGVITWVPYLSKNGTLAVDDAMACVGREFTLNLSLDENPGVMALAFRLDYDASVLEFVGAEDGALTGWIVNTENAVLEWDSDRDQTGTGTLIKLRFLVKENAAPGTTAIGIADLQAGNFHEESVLFDLASGTVEIVPHTAGDANGDGEVDSMDLVRLRNYLVGVEPQIVEGNTDVNYDKGVDLLDLVRMVKYFAQQDVILE